MQGRKARQGWLLAIGLILGNAQAAMACAFHGYTPNPTLVDVLLETEQVVIARLSPTARDRLDPTQTLRGPAVDELPAGLDPGVRARLAADPQARILLLRDGAYGPWIAAAILTPGYRQLIDHVLDRQDKWQSADGNARLRYFAGRINDPNPDIRHLALRELDRAPYGDLKRLRLQPLPSLRRDLETGDPDLRPIRLLLAGLSGDSSFTPYLTAGLDRAIRDDVPFTGAYATALMALGGPDTAVALRNRYLSSGELSPSNRDKLISAYALHYKTGPAPMRRVIAGQIADLARQSPEFAEAAALQFGFAGVGRLDRSGAVPRRAPEPGR